MIFKPTGLEGAFVIELERIEDERGHFARTWCAEEFRARGLNPRVVQCSVSFNRRRATLRGLHYQAEPYAEAKLVRVTRGRIYDVVVDLRPDSPSFKRWFALELGADDQKMLYSPEGFAHGFQTLADDTEVLYQISESYRPEAARGVRWNDPALSIEWPLAELVVISKRDSAYPDFSG